MSYLFQGNHVRFDIRIDISISITPMITKFGSHVNLQDLTQMTALREDHVTN